MTNPSTNEAKPAEIMVVQVQVSRQRVLNFSYATVSRRNYVVVCNSQLGGTVSGSTDNCVETGLFEGRVGVHRPDT